MSKKNHSIFRVIFANEECIYEIYATSVCESEMFGFIEIENMVFGDSGSVVIDPSEERLKNEFSDVKRIYVPMHAVVRIDEVEKEGISKVHDATAKSSNISQFPGVSIRKSTDSDKGKL